MRLICVLGALTSAGCFVSAETVKTAQQCFALCEPFGGFDIYIWTDGPPRCSCEDGSEITHSADRQREE